MFYVFFYYPWSLLRHLMSIGSHEQKASNKIYIVLMRRWARAMRIPLVPLHLYQLRHQTHNPFMFRVRHFHTLAGFSDIHFPGGAANSCRSSADLRHPTKVTPAGIPSPAASRVSFDHALWLALPHTQPHFLYPLTIPHLIFLRTVPYPVFPRSIWPQPCHVLSGCYLSPELTYYSQVR